MNAPILIKIIIGLGILAVIFSYKIVPFLRDKLFMNISKSGYIATIIVIAVVSAFGVAINRYQNNERKYAAEDREKAKKERLIRKAFEISKKEMKHQLKSPSTAKFASEFDEESKYQINDDESIIIRSYVDAQNAFGATVRTYFKCTVDKDGNIDNFISWQK